MDRTEVVLEKPYPPMEFYRCGKVECGRKAVVIYEPATGMDHDTRSWVDKEIARRGAFFPGDYVGRGKYGR